MTAKKKKLNRKSWIVQRLRRMSLKWPPRNRARIKNRREYYKTRKDGSLYAKPNYEYQCNHCQEWFPDKDITLDHIVPVVDPKDNESYTEEEFIGKFAISLLCYDEGWQNLCILCHDVKTREENEQRVETRQNKD